MMGLAIERLHEISRYVRLNFALYKDQEILDMIKFIIPNLSSSHGIDSTKCGPTVDGKKRLSLKKCRFCARSFLLLLQLEIHVNPRSIFEYTVSSPGNLPLIAYIFLIASTLLPKFLRSYPEILRTQQSTKILRNKGIFHERIFHTIILSLQIEFN